MDLPGTGVVPLCMCPRVPDMSWWLCTVSILDLRYKEVFCSLGAFETRALRGEQDVAKPSLDTGADLIKG